MDIRDELSLVEPCLELAGEYLAVIDEYIAAGEGRPSYETMRNDFPAYLEQAQEMKRGAHMGGANLPPGFVPMTSFWLVHGACAKPGGAKPGGARLAGLSWARAACAISSTRPWKRRAGTSAT